MRDRHSLLNKIEQKEQESPGKARDLPCHVRMLNCVCFILGSRANKSCSVRIVSANGIRFMNGPALERSFDAFSQKAMES